MKASSLLFVCLGNICRSPAAEGVMRKRVREAGLDGRVRIAPAGTIGLHAGELPDPRMRAAAARRDCPLESRARAFELADFDRFDLILPMDAKNLRHLRGLARGPADLAKLRPFCDYCRHHEETEVPDPYYGGDEGFEQVLDLLEDGCTQLLVELQTEASRGS